MTRWAYPALMAALIGLVCAPLILHPDYLLYPRGSDITDLTITHWPAVAFNSQTFHQEGQIPLWRTTIASGGPWAANPQSWLFYPPAWLFFILPLNLTFNLLLLAHLALAAGATFVFGRRALGLERPGAALAGLAFALAPWLTAQLAAGHVNVALALAWLPVALLGAHQAALKSPGGALLAGVAWAACVLNHPQIAAFTIASTVAWFLLAAQGRLSRQVISLFIMATIALLLSAALLIPLVEALPYLSRGAMTVNEAGVFSLSWTSLLAALVPAYGGEAEQTIYLGVPVAILAAVGLTQKRDRIAWFLAGGVMLSLLFALGTNGPIFPFLFRWVPGLAWLRVPARAWALVAFSLALLAGRGLDAITCPRLTASARRRITLTSLVALTAGLTLAIGLAFLYHPVPTAAWMLALLTLSTAATLVLCVRSPARAGPLAVIIFLLVTADVGMIRAAWTEMRTPEEAFAWGADTAAFLAGQPGRFRTYSPSYDLPQHTAVQHGLGLADGVDPFQLAHYADMLALAGGYQRTGYSVTLPPRLNDTGAQPDAARLGLLNVGYVAASFPIEVEGLTLEAQFGETYVYANEQVLPRSFVVTQEQAPASDRVALQHPLEVTPADVVVYTPNRIVVKADVAAPGLLVLSEIWYPGWQALVDGDPVPIQRVENALRGVPLDAGPHTIEFRYAPWTVRAGLVISGTTALALAGYAVTRLISARRHR